MADPITKSVVGIAGSVLNKFVADKNLKMKLEHELKTQLQTANLAQIEVNKVEAASKNWFVAGWRPSVGWGCSVAMMVHFIVLPVGEWIAALSGVKVDMPEFINHQSVRKPKVKKDNNVTEMDDEYHTGKFRNSKPKETS